MLGSIPELRAILQDKLIVAKPQVTQGAQLVLGQARPILNPFINFISKQPYVKINNVIRGVTVGTATLDTTDNFDLTHGQSLTVEQIDKILDAAGSPAKGTGADWIKYGKESDIDAAYGLGIFNQESTLGTNSGWYKAGYNTGNIICAGYWQCHGAFRDYSQDADPWASSIKDVMALLRNYRDGGIKNYGEAIYKWAPPVENDTDGYIRDAQNIVAEWRKAAIKNGQVALTPISLTNSPLRQQIIDKAREQMGKGYILGAAGPDHFDCSGLTSWTYKQFGMEITRTTFTQLEAPQLREITPDQIKMADMIYFQFPSDQHVGFLVDLDNDGKWDMVQSGGIRSDVNETFDVLNDPVYMNNIIGFRTAFNENDELNK